MASKQKSGGGAKIGRGREKPCQKRYVSEHRAQRNALRRAKKHEKRLAYFAVRRERLKPVSLEPCAKGIVHGKLVQLPDPKWDL